MPALARDGNHGHTVRMSQFDVIKTVVMDLTGLEKDALHIYVALAVFSGSCLILKWKAWQWKPWLLVLVFALLGEVWDIQGTMERNEPVRLWYNWHDVWNTMLIPTALVILSRFSTMFAAPQPVPASEPDSAPDEGSGDQT